jgi:hypothetical protein|tara:strand:+ start:243 stop:503 length:261 start_codon:yes stop_codon:yes gene_type:complete
VNTSSHKKGILPVKLGLQPDNKTALKELGMDPSLADQMTDEQLDEHIIQTEHDRIVDFYNGKGMEEEGMQRARDYKNQALNKARSF